jgi:hypothetical protein
MFKTDDNSAKRKSALQQSANAGTHTHKRMSTVTFRAAPNKLNTEHANWLLKYFSTLGR